MDIIRDADFEDKIKNIDIPECIIYMDNIRAGQVITKCRNEDIRIPEDIRVASFYNSSILKNMVPSVTSLNFDDTNLGAVAARTLIDKIEGKEVKNRTETSYEVVLKDSTK